jgi:hypothetical protein
MKNGHLTRVRPAEITAQLFTCALLALLLPAVAVSQNGSTLNHKLNQIGFPICLGVSGYNEVSYNMGAGCNTGTLGSLLEDQNGIQYILSNAHVLAPAGAALGNPIQHVGSADTIACGNALAIDDLTGLPPGMVVTSAPGNVANLSQCAGPNGAPCHASTLVDAAIAQVISGQVANSILDIPNYRTAVEGPVLDDVVIKSGRTTARTAGKIYMVNVTIGGLMNQIAIAPYVPANPYPDGFSQPGDSGSLILQSQGGQGHPQLGPVGLLWGGYSMAINGITTKLTVASRIDDVLNTFFMNNHLKLSFVKPTKCTVSFPFGEKPGDEENNLPAEGNSLGQNPKEDKEMRRIPAMDEVSPDLSVVDAASKVKERYADMLMRMPNVVGTGVGLSSTGSRQVVIKLLVKEKASDELRRVVPPNLAGIPVEIIDQVVRDF